MKYGITPDELAGSKNQVKGLVKKAILNIFKPTMEETCQGKSKMTYFLEDKENWLPGTRAKYMNELTRKQASMIFRARCRMIKVKGNYKNGHKDLKCRMCKNHEETQTHILQECPVLHTSDALKVPKHRLFNESIDTLRETANTLEIIMDRLNEVVN